MVVIARKDFELKNISWKSKRKISEWLCEIWMLLLKRKREAFIRYLTTNIQATWEE